MNFIVTSDKATAELLKENGFVLQSENNGKYTFINDGNKINFSDETKKKVAYTNKICL